MEKPFVLVADDNEASCTLVKAILRHDFTVETVNDGFEAIERLKSRQYAAIVLDLLMPGVDGYAVLDFVAAERPDLQHRVIVVTASATRREMDRLAGYRICDVITKPFEVDALLAAVKQCTAADGDGDGPSHPGGSLLSSGMILLLADFLRQRLM